MNLVFSGAVNGKLEELYVRVKNLEQRNKILCDWVICVGEFGVWPDPAFTSRNCKPYIDDPYFDFATRYLKQTPALRPTLFIAGAHEDHNWLNNRIVARNLEILPGTHWLAQGNITDIGLHVIGLGKVYSPLTFKGEYSKKKRNHYTRKEVNKACSAGQAQLALFNQPPAGVIMDGFKSEAEGLNNILFATRPNLFVHSCKQQLTEYTHSSKTKGIAIPPGTSILIQYDNNKFSDIIDVSKTL